MGQQQLADIQLTRPAEHRIEMGMGRVRLAPKAVADPQVDAVVQGSHFGCKIMKINGIAKGAAFLRGANAKRGDAAVRLVDETQHRPAQHEIAIERLGFDDCAINSYVLKEIGETAAKPLQHFRARKERHPGPGTARSALVDAVAMVGMVVRNENLTDIDPIRGQQLLAQVRPAVDQQPLAIAFNQDRGAGAAVPGLDGSQRPQSLPIRGTPVDAATEYPDLHAAALLNSLKKLAVVAGPARRAARRAGRTGRRRCPRRTPARTSCPGSAPARGTGNRSRPAAGRAGCFWRFPADPERS